MPLVALGSTVKDVITGYEGVVTARYEYLHGCTRLEVSSREMKDGVPVNAIVLDEQRVKILDDIPNILEEAPLTNKPGGERPIPVRPSGPSY